MRKLLLLMFALLTSLSGAWAQTDVTIVDGTNDPFNYFGSRNNSATPNTLTTNSRSGVVGVVLTAPVMDKATWWNTRCLSIMPSATQTDETVSLTVPDGYTIAGISMVLRANSSYFPYDVTFNGSTTRVTGGQDFSFSKNDINAKTFSFTINHTQANFDNTNKWLAVKSLTLKVAEDPAYVSTLASVSQNKCYTVTCNRSAWAVDNNGTSLTTIAKLDLAPLSSDRKQQFAFVTPDNGSRYYLYSIKAGKYVTSSNTLTDDATQAEPVYFADASSYKARAVRVYYNASKNINVGGGNQITIDTWATADDGCAYLIKEAGDFDPTVALAIFATTVDVTYALYESDGTTFVGNTIVVQEKNSAVSIPSAISSNTYFDYVTEGSIGTSDCTIKVTRTPKTGIVYPYTNLSNNKKYTIKTRNNARGALSTYTDNGTTYLASPVKSALGISAKDFAILSYEGNYYLYSVDDSKFVTYKSSNNAPLADCITGTSDRVGFSLTSAPLYELRFDNSDGKILNSSDSYTYGIIINGWGASSGQWDDGCQYSIEEAGDFNPTAALAVLEDFFHPTHTITYVVKDSENNTLFTSDPVGAPIGTTYNTLPSEYHRDYFYTYGSITPVTITSSSAANTNVEVVATAKSDVLQYTADTSSPIYYNINIRNKYMVYNDEEGQVDVKLSDASVPFNPYAAWAFIGSPYGGFKIINQQKGTDSYLTYTSVVTESHSANNVQFVADANFTNQYWNVEANNNGFVLRMKENPNIYFHHDNTNNYLRTCSVSEWSGVHNDAGSTLIFSSDEQVLQDLYEELQYVFFGDAIGLYSNNSGLDNEEARADINGAGLALQYHATSAYKDLYDALHTIKEQMSHGNITLNTPAVGYYRLKNVATDKYLKATNLATDYTDTHKYVYANGNSSEVGTVIRLFDKDKNNTLYMYNQGYSFGWVVASKSYGAGVGYLTTNPDKYVHWFPGKAANQIAFAICYGNGEENDEGNYTSYLKQGIYTTDNTDESVIAGTDYTTDAAQWVVEPATSVTVNLNNGGDGFYYATCFTDFPVSYTGASNGEGLFVLTGGENNNKVTAQKVDAVPAQQGFLIRLAAENVTESKVTLTIPASADALTGTNVLTGTCLATTKPDGNVYVFSKVGDDLGFFPYTGTDNIPANRAYIVEPAGSGTRSFILSFDETTGLNGVSTSTPAGTIFDMQGRRVQTPARGLYIVNGKKVLF